MRPIPRPKFLVSRNHTETNDTQSQASRPRLKRGSIAKIKTDTGTKSKHKEEKLSNQVKIVLCFKETSLNESLSSRDRDFLKLVSAFETLRSQSQFRDRETADGRD